MLRRKRELRRLAIDNSAAASSAFSPLGIAVILCLFLNVGALRELPSSRGELNRRHLLQERNSRCRGTVCSGHGECEGRTAECVCQDGYTGLDCQLDDVSCPNGQLNATGQCCQSGVFDTSGRCCGDNDSESTWRLDQQGRCCNQELNGCGECGGVGYLDARGNCCSGTLDAGGLCCPSAHLDECGVCDGVGESCKTHLELILDEESDSPEDCLTDFLPTLITPSIPNISLSFEVAERRSGFVCIVNMSGGAVRTNSFRRHLDRIMTNTEPNPCLIRNVTALSKSPTCGNGICEIGEADGVESEYLCPEDCHFSFTMCPFRGEDGIVGDVSLPCSGNGRCLFAREGRCECMDGYSSERCDQCADGYFLLNNLCHPRQMVYLASTENNTEDAPIPVPATRRNAGDAETNEDSQLSMASDDDRALIITLCCFGLVGVLVLPPVIAGLRQRCGKQGDKGARSERDPLDSHPSQSLLSVYLQQFRDFQNSPPWVGSIERPEQGESAGTPGSRSGRLSVTSRPSCSTSARSLAHVSPMPSISRISPAISRAAQR